MLISKIKKAQTVLPGLLFFVSTKLFNNNNQVFRNTPKILAIADLQFFNWFFTYQFIRIAWVRRQYLYFLGAYRYHGSLAYVYLCKIIAVKIFFDLGGFSNAHKAALLGCNTFRF